MTEDENSLGGYLRARREQVTPEAVGLRQVGLRRTPGLRREEVAMLAGISADYYLRLEQGRDRNPSAQVLEALARVLQLDATGTEYLLSLVGRPKKKRRARKETVPESIRTLLGTLPLPAFVESRCFDVLASNALAVALSPRLAVGGNRLRDIFLDPAEQALYGDWQRAGAGLVAGFRASVGTDIDDPRFIELVGELSLASESFRTVWARHDVVRWQGSTQTLNHPQVGQLTIYREKLAITGTNGQLLVVCHAEPGTDNADKLALLAMATAPASPGTPASGAPQSPRTRTT
ncbi:helix-turn-helix domain-containing protein [Kutzneria sp. CA-103260]|uniref:helix-turn-helix domain-containing protein n=1 Tax=Kutzneria sp. CA-103260 TaxID=2802641 RepID=UPI001BA67951|nr:helix-turn-helix transcriptional regulator [Kutzneria sp. CA-103260]QUQ65814.1 DNA-binding protein [Kutzneria sp. CA-103260]